MSSHRRVKDVAYDDDDIDDYDDDYAEEEEGMSAEDKEQMQQGTIKVKEELGPGFNLSNKEIEETLWHYYYDIGKSVTYLKNKHAAPTSKLKATTQPRQQKTASKFDQAINAAAKAAPTKINGLLPAYPLLPQICYSDDPIIVAREFFKDTPWTKVPLNRQGNISIEPLHPRGGLLGGSSKPSKLAALAAARKKKAEEEKSKVANGNHDPISRAPDRAIALLDRLEGRSAIAKGPATPLAETTASTAATEFDQGFMSGAFTLRRKKNPSPPPAVSAKPPPIEATSDTKDPITLTLLPELVAQPSSFARTVAGAQSNHAVLQARDGRVFSIFSEVPDYAKQNPFSGPSPDDVVLNAQSKGSLAKATGAKSQNGEKNPDSASNGTNSISVDGAVRVKSKNFNVQEEYEKSGLKEAASFVVIGHVDHGKSTLMGRLLFDLKVVDQRSIDKLQKEAQSIGKSSFTYAWVMDQTSEERSRGVTVDIATNYFETKSTRFTILDAPGHQDFIPNMIAGTSQADFAVLVVDASTNGFESGLRGQTKEHALLARSIGVQKLVVAVNKMDAAHWSKDRYEEIRQQMSAFLTSAGFQAKNISFVPCAGLTGDNIASQYTKQSASWYNGPSLITALESSEPASRAIEKPLRMTISDIFRGGVTNPLSISGRIESGSLQVGDVIMAMPSGETGYIKAIEADTNAMDWAVAGQIVTLHLAEIDPIHLRLGDIVCHPDNPVHNVKAFTAKVLAFEHVVPGYLNVHKGRLNVAGRVSKLIATLDKSSGEVAKKKPKVIQPGTVARVEVEMDAAIPLEVGTRVVLRSEGQTVAAGLLESVRSS